MLLCVFGFGTCETASSPDTNYRCALPAGEQLQDELWDRDDWRPPMRTRALLGFWSFYPSAPAWLKDRGLETFFLPLELDDGRVALLFRDREQREDGSLVDGPWQFAALDADEQLIAGPRPIEAWGSKDMALKSYAVSAEGTLALAYQPLVSPGPISTLLLDSKGVAIGQRTYKGVHGIAGLQSTARGDFVMIMARAIGGESLSFANLSRGNVFHEDREPIAESKTIRPLATVQLIPLSGGYVLAWEERLAMAPNPEWQPSSGTLRFRQLNAEGHPLAAARAVLPPSELPFQGQLSWVRFGEALALSWAEGGTVCISGERYDCDWPEQDERYWFMLVSAHDLEARSDVLEIPKSGGLGYPALFFRAGELGLFAEFWTEDDGAQPSAPATITCAPK